MGTIAGPTNRELYEFGPFRVDVEKETLQRAGEPVPLTPKTFQILLVLVRHSQEIVTKDDLLKTVWPDTFVEEANLSRNIFMLRRALGESPKDHRYILTVPGRGYRLAESVHLLPGHELSLVSATHSRVEIETVESAETKPWSWAAAGAAFLLIAIAGGVVWKSEVPKPGLAQGTPSSSRSSPTIQAIPCLRAPCVRVLRCNWRSPLSLVSSRTGRSSGPSGSWTSR